jgi:hypothetical protein
MTIATLVLVLMLATVVQYLVDLIKKAVPAKTIGGVQLAPIYAAVIGVTTAVTFQVGLLTAVGFQTPYAMADWVITGLILSGGSSVVHELIAKLRASRNLIQDELTGGKYDENS